MKPRLSTLALAALFLLYPAVTMRLKPAKYVSPHGDSTGRERLQTSNAMSRILGEIRSGLGDMMFMKTEVYMHSGIGYEVKLNAESLQSTGQVKMGGSKEDIAKGIDSRTVSELSREVKEEMNVKPGEVVAEKHEEPAGHAHNDFGDEGARTLIPTPLEDFRGFIGDMEREVKPWRDPSLEHIHTSGDELLPWYRMITLVDPQNVRGYMIGSWWLLSQRTDQGNAEALQFLDEGISNNPEAFQLWLMKGRVHDRRYETAKALEAWEQSRKLALAQRPAGGVDNEEWSDYKESDARAAAHFEVFTRRDEGQIAEACRVATEMLRVFPGYTPFTEFLEEVKQGKWKEGEKRPPPDSPPARGS